ncbi:multi-sensor hybrid histidine kinase [Rhodotorula toruloides]|uniref:Multi-sensor hybrid histidine kinase n=1 Tax=Rhodotorula toruloides TaxID=5286 RepID=A0A511KQ39_RHOTO|nr:multi-sensor hybrid histidine kinase [Rhodotorula toruloides]
MAATTIAGGNEGVSSPTAVPGDDKKDLLAQSAEVASAIPPSSSARSTPSSASASASASTSTDSSTAAAARASSATGTGTGSRTGGAGSATPPGAQPPRSGSNPRAHARAERILAETFDASPSSSSKDSRSSGGRKPFVASSLLEGGAQKSHDPSRTAEGAVKAMYEQRAQREKDEKEHEERVAEREEALEDERREREKREFEVSDRWSWRRESEDGPEGASRGAPSVSGTASSSGGAATAPSASATSGGGKAASGSGTGVGAQVRSSPRGQGLALRDLLTPVWRNGKWKEMMAIRDDAKKRRSSVPRTPAQEAGAGAPFDKSTSHGPAPNDRESVEGEEEIELITLLSRADAQECLAMLVNVVKPLNPSRRSEEQRQREVPLAQLNHTVRLELNFPESSIYRHPPGSNFFYQHSTNDSLQTPRDEAAPSQGVPSVYQTMQRRQSSEHCVPSYAPGTPPAVPILPRNPPSDRTMPVYSPANAYQTPLASASDVAARSSVSSATGVCLGIPNPTHTSVSATASASTSPAPNAPASNQNPAVPPVHHGVQQETNLLRPFLQLVATLHEDSDLVIITSILANMPLPVTLTGSPGQRDSKKREKSGTREERKVAKEAKREERENAESREADKDKEKEELSAKAEPVLPLPLPRGLADGENGIDSNATSGSASPQQPLSNKSTPPATSSPFPQGYTPSRPPLAQRGTSHSSMSGASSTGSTVVGPALGAPPVPRPVSPHTSTDLSHPHNPEQPLPATSAEPTYHSRGLSAPLETPAISDELKELWADMDRSGTFKNEPPVGFVEEKESRAAIRRRGAGPFSVASQREYDNEVRERNWQHKEKKREREMQREKDDRDAGLGEGLSELQELDEPSESEHDRERDRDEGEEDEDGVGRLDEESEEDDGEDDGDLDRLRRQTRTGSTSSAGSAHEREEAQRAAQADHEPQSRSISQQRPRSQDAVSATGSQASSISSTSSRASRVSTSVHPPRLSGDAGLVVHELPSAADVSGRASHTFDDPFLNTIAQTPCGRLIISVDWSRTTLGPIATWGAEIRSHIMSMLASPFHTAIWLGENSVLLYNDAYSRILGPSKHPAAMGKMGAEGWQEIWETLGPLAAQVMLGKTMSFSDHCNCIYRNGMVEETYMTWAFMPVRASDASIIGYTNPSFETTARVIAERRLGTLRELSQLTQLARTTKDFCTKALRGISSNPLDLPFAILYSCDTTAINPGRRTKGSASTESSGLKRSSTESSGLRQPSQSGEPTQTSTGIDGTSTVGRVHLTLQGAVGVPKGHPSAPAEVDVIIDTQVSQDSRAGKSNASTASTNSTNDDNSTSTVWPFVEVLQSHQPIFISELGQRSQGFEHRGWPDDVHRAVVIPIRVEGSSVPKAVLIVGLNPRRPWNSVYAVFLNLITRTLSTGLLGIEVAEEQARKSQELVELNDARQALFSNVSHELRTPLTLILGPLEDVMHSKATRLDHDDREKLDVVLRNAHRLLNMVNTLLDFSRLESGKMNTKYRPTLLGPRVVELSNLFRAAIERGGIEFSIDVQPDKYAESNPFYLSDEMLDKIVLNLLGNSFKYCLAGWIKVKVRFTSSEGLISISDSGVGIKEEDLQTIFERFARVDSSARSFEGTGIGLSLVLELVKALGGTIDVESKFGAGSTFIVRLPRGCAHLPQEAIDHEPYESMTLPPRAAQSLAIINDAAAWRTVPKDSRKADGVEGGIERRADAAKSPSPTRRASDAEPVPSVFNLEKQSTVCLVVDDNAQLRAFISNTLSKMFTVVEAADGREALDYALNHPVSIVVTDLAMPVMGGRELLAALRKDPKTSLVPIIFLSAQAGSEARVDALLLGADDYIVKPFQARELMARVNVHLQLGQMRKELERRVTERTAALLESEKKLKELADQHQTLALVSPVGIFQTDREGNMVFVNPQFYVISGHPDGVPHSEWPKDVWPEDLPRVEKLWNDAISNWAPDKHASFEYRYKKGNWAQLEIRSFEKGYIGSITDITHQKEVEAFHVSEVEQRARDAEENRRNTEMFLDMSSHELRNPLSGVWQNAEVVAVSLEKITQWLDDLRNGGKILDPPTLEEMHEEMLENLDAIESIQICASHQTRIADDILNVSKLNMGLLTINVAPFDLVAAVGEVVKTFEVTSHQQHIQLSVQRGDSLDKLKVDWIVADSGRIKQILYNFLTNALKYTADSQRKAVTVHLDAFETAPPTPSNAMRIASTDQSLEPPPDCVWCIVGVEDSGKGLTPEQLKLLFSRFKQANPKTDQYGGSGLGLYVSKKLVELHRGFIEVASEPGKGSTFRFAIPASRAPRPSSSSLSPQPHGLALGPKRLKRPTSSSGRPPTAAMQALASASATSPSPTPTTGSHPLRVLVAEDNLINQKVLFRQLKNAGYEVTLASNGNEALKHLEEDIVKPPAAQYEVLLLDIEMPEKRGDETAQILRQWEKDGKTSRRYPIVALTANARVALTDSYLAAGFDDVITKPYQLQDLLARIRNLVSPTRLHEAAST